MGAQQTGSISNCPKIGGFPDIHILLDGVNELGSLSVPDQARYGANWASEAIWYGSSLPNTSCLYTDVCDCRKISIYLLMKKYAYGRKYERTLCASDGVCH